MDVRFKRHILRHWITSKRNETYPESIRRIYSGGRTPNLEVPEDIEGMGDESRPYELPAKYVGQFICKIRCPVCNRDFQTAVPATDFLTSGSPRVGAFVHYVDDAGCGSAFTVLETRHMRMKVLVMPADREPYETWVDATP